MRRSLAAGGLVIALGSVVPYLRGAGTRVRAWDNLDSNWVWWELQHRAGSLWRFGGEVAAPLGGVPAEALGSDYYLPRLLVGAFGLVTAYVVTQAVMHVVAYVGMLLLLRRVAPEGVAVGVAVVFAWVPFWPPAFLSIAGLPLLAHAYLNVRDGAGSRVDWLVLAVMPFCSIVVYAVPFVALVMAGDLLRSRRSLRPLAVYLAAGLLAEVELVVGSVVDPWDSHRLAWGRSDVGAGDVIRDGVLRFTEGTSHTWAGHGVLLTTVVLAGVALTWRRAEGRVVRLAVGGAALAVLLAALEHLSVFQAAKAHAGSVGTLQWRFDWLAPPLLFVALAFALTQLLRFRGGVLIVGGVLALLLVGMVDRSEWRDGSNLTLDEFYAPAVFDQIHLGPGRVGSVGLHPAIAQHAGMKTVDGYLTSYPLAYKRAFRRVIADELGRDAAHRRYFDEWGSRAYLLSAGLPARVDRPSQVPTSVDLDLDLDAFAALGGRYLLASTEIRNATALGLTMVGRYHDEQSPWQVRVYEVAT